MHAGAVGPLPACFHVLDQLLVFGDKFRKSTSAKYEHLVALIIRSKTQCCNLKLMTLEQSNTPNAPVL